jgi:hypothetical protein
MKYLGRIYGYIAEDPLQSAKADILIEDYSELLGPLHQPIRK